MRGRGINYRIYSMNISEQQLNNMMSAVTTALQPLIRALPVTPVEWADQNYYLPKESSSVILLGFLRKDISIALLTPFALSAKQMVIACIFMAMYMPCTASFFVLLREGGLKDGLKIIAITLCVSIAIGGLLNFIL